MSNYAIVAGHLIHNEEAAELRVAEQPREHPEEAR